MFNFLFCLVFCHLENWCSVVSSLFGGAILPCVANFLVRLCYMFGFGICFITCIFACGCYSFSGNFFYTAGKISYIDKVSSLVATSLNYQFFIYWRRNFDFVFFDLWLERVICMLVWKVDRWLIPEKEFVLQYDKVNKIGNCGKRILGPLRSQAIV